MTQKAQLINGKSRFKMLSSQKRYKEIYDYETQRVYLIDQHTGQCLVIRRQNLNPKLMELANFDRQIVVLVDTNILFGEVTGFKKVAEYYSLRERMHHIEFELKTRLSYNGQPNQPVIIRRRVAKVSL